MEIKGLTDLINILNKTSSFNSAEEMLTSTNYEEALSLLNQNDIDSIDENTSLNLGDNKTANNPDNTAKSSSLVNMQRLNNLLEESIQKQINTIESKMQSIEEKSEEKAKEYESLVTKIEQKQEEYTKLQNELNCDKMDQDINKMTLAQNLYIELQGMCDDLDLLKSDIDSLSSQYESQSANRDSLIQQANTISQSSSIISKQLSNIQTESINSVSATANINEISSVNKTSKIDAIQKVDASNWTVEDYGKAAIAKLSELTTLASKNMSDDCYNVAADEAETHMLQYLDLDEDGKITYKDVMGLMVAKQQLLGDDYTQRVQQCSEKTANDTEKLKEDAEATIKRAKEIRGDDKTDGFWDPTDLLLKIDSATEKNRNEILGTDFWTNKIYTKYIDLAEKEAANQIYDLDEANSIQQLLNNSNTFTETNKKDLNSAITNIAKNLNINKIISDENWESKLDNLDINDSTKTKLKETIQKAVEFAQKNPEQKQLAGIYVTEFSNLTQFNCLDINGDGVVNFSDLNAIPDEFDFDGDGTVDKKEQERIKRLKTNAATKLTTELRNDSGTKKTYSYPKKVSAFVGGVGLCELSVDTAGGISQKNSYKANWDIDELIGMLQYTETYNSNRLSNKFSTECQIIKKITDSLDYAFPTDTDLQKMIDAIDNCSSEVVKEKLSDLKAKALENIEKNKTSQMASGSFEEVADANGLQIITANSKTNSEALKKENDSLSVNNYDLNATDKSTYDFYMKLTGKCSKSLKVYGYGMWVEYIDGELRYAFNADNEKEEYELAKSWFIRAFGESNVCYNDKEQSLSLNPNLTIEELSKASGIEIVYGPQCNSKHSVGGVTYETPHDSGANVPQIYYLFNGKVIFSSATSQSYQHANCVGAVPVYKNISTEALKDITNFYAKKAGYSMN